MSACPHVVQRTGAGPVRGPPTKSLQVRQNEHGNSFRSVAFASPGSPAIVWRSNQRERLKNCEISCGQKKQQPRTSENGLSETLILSHANTRATFYVITVQPANQTNSSQR